MVWNTRVESFKSFIWDEFTDTPSKTFKGYVYREKKGRVERFRIPFFIWGLIIGQRLKGIMSYNLLLPLLPGSYNWIRQAKGVSVFRNVVFSIFPLTVVIRIEILHWLLKYLTVIRFKPVGYRDAERSLVLPWYNLI